jgi:hypothetical protein
VDLLKDVLGVLISWTSHSLRMRGYSTIFDFCGGKGARFAIVFRLFQVVVLIALCIVGVGFLEGVQGSWNERVAKKFSHGSREESTSAGFAYIESHGP